MHIAAVEQIADRLLPAVRALRDTLDAKARAFADIVMIGRTHLQDATPLTLGQMISGWVAQLDQALRASSPPRCPACCELAIGGTAVGTGLNAHPRFGAAVARERSPPRPASRSSRRPNKFAALAGARGDGQRQRRAAHPGRRADEDRQRRALVRLRPARRHRRAAHPGERARLLDHARQDQPDAVRGADHGLRAGVRQRRRGGLRRLAGQLPAQRLQAGDAAQRAGIDRAAGRCLPQLRRALRARHRAGHEADAATPATTR